jgi:hypothetical protein
MWSFTGQLGIILVTHQCAERLVYRKAFLLKSAINSQVLFGGELLKTRKRFIFMEPAPGLEPGTY